MNFREQIRAILFLCIFSMFMLHQALPHEHHKHEGLADSVGQTGHQDHHHDKDHQHHDGGDDFDFLDFLLGNHAHGTHAENTPTVKSNVKPFVAAKDIPVLAMLVFQDFSVTKYEPEKSMFRQQPPDYSCNRYLFTSSLRGPPSLG